MLIRDIVKGTARRMNEQTVRLVETLEENFPDVKVFVDSMSETDGEGNQITTIDPVTNEITYNVNEDFMFVQSGDIVPTQQNGKCYYQERTLVVFASVNRPDILEDILVLTAIPNNSTLWKLENIDKEIQPLGNSGEDLTIIEATYSRLVKV